MNLPIRFGIAILVLGAAATAGPLQQASISQIVNDVQVIEPRQGARPAVLQDLIQNDVAVATGRQSRAELLFQDRTLTRLGSETLFSFTPGTRDIKVDRGSMLLQVPKGLGGARIRAASVTASITGTTIMVENLPGSAVKIVVLEGSLKVELDRLPGSTLVLDAGKMVTLPTGAKEMPKAVDADLRKVVQTSALVNGALFPGKIGWKAPALPSMKLIEEEIAKQKAELGKPLKAVDIETAPIKPTGRPGEMSADEIAMATEALRNVEATLPVAAPTGEPRGKTRSGIDTPAAELVALMTGVNGISSTTTQMIGGTTSTTGTGTGTTGTGTTGTGTTGTGTTGTGTTGTGTTGTGTTGTGTTGTGTTGTGTTGTGTTGTGTTGTGTTGTGTSPAITPPAYITSPSPYITDSSTSIVTGAQTITTRGVTDAGGLYQSAAVNGPASAWVFDTPSAFDTATGLDAKFSIMNTGTAPSGGVAVYRFTGLAIQNSIAFNTTGGPIDVALVGATGITANSSGVLSTGPLRSLFFGTENGPITLGQEVRATSGSLKYVQAYARGSAGTFTLNNKINTPSATFFVDAEAGIRVSSAGSIVAMSTIFNTPGPILMETSPLSAVVKLTSGTGIQFSKALASADVEMTAPALQTAGSLSALTGHLDIGAGGIDAGGNSLSGFDHIDVVGNVRASSVSVTNALTIGGTYTTGATTGAGALSGGTIAVAGGIDFTGLASGAGGALTLNGTDLSISTTGVNGIKADGRDGLLGLIAGGNGGTVNIGTSTKPVANSVTVDKPISATTGANATGILTGGNGGTVNVVAAGTIAVNSTMKVSDSAVGRASKKGGTVTLDSRKTTGTAIAVSNSGQLLALLNAAATGGGGKITFTSAGGDILVNGGTVQADKGTVDIRNNGAGNIALTNATIRGDVVKVGALGANGQLLIGGGTISADTSLKLYGGTTNGQVRFTDDVTLGGLGTKIIAGKTVTIDSGKTVTVGGLSAAKVYTDNANYTGSGGNGSTSGRFGGAGATTQTFNKKPAF